MATALPLLDVPLPGYATYHAAQLDACSQHLHTLANEVEASQSCGKKIQPSKHTLWLPYLCFYLGWGEKLEKEMLNLEGKQDYIMTAEQTLELAKWCRLHAIKIKELPDAASDVLSTLDKLVSPLVVANVAYPLVAKVSCAKNHS